MLSAVRHGCDASLNYLAAAVSKRFYGPTKAGAALISQMVLKRFNPVDIAETLDSNS